MAIRAQSQENPPSQPASVGVIVVCHGRAAADVLPRCLRAIAAQTRRPESVLVLDSPGPGPSAATVVAGASDGGRAARAFAKRGGMGWRRAGRARCAKVG